jgi:predicted acetyltransferase
MDVSVRLITEDEFDAVYDCALTTFGVPASDEDRADTREWIELDRTFAAFDGDMVAATAGIVSLPLMVPGGSVVPTAAVTLVTTAPTHRRQGLMSATMRAMLDQAVERQEPVATLWASESKIYGRFGFGAANTATEAEIAMHHTALRPDAPTASGVVRVLDSARAAQTIPEVYERATAGIPGTLIRRTEDWRQLFKDVGAARNGKTTMRYAVYEQDGLGLGFVRYRNTENWKDMNAEGEVEIFEFHASSADAYAALWRFISSLDLMATIKIHADRHHSRIATLLQNPRRLRATIGESMWVRILDPVGALGARRYGAPGEVVIEIEDAMGYAAGRFALSGDQTTATVTKVGSEPDVVLSAESIGAAYLGAARLSELAWAGRVTGDASAIAVLDAMMGWPVEPYCTVHF